MRSRSSSLPVRVGVFSTMPQADRAVEQLAGAGFDRRHITVICPSCDPRSFADVDREEPAGAHTPQAAVAGGAIGAVLGGLAAATSLIATGGASLLALGPLVAGAGGGAVAGGFIGAMMTRGFEREVADYYDQAVQEGKILVSVEEKGGDAGVRLALAEAILTRAGAEPIALPEG